MSTILVTLAVLALVALWLFQKNKTTFLPPELKGWQVVYVDTGRSVVFTSTRHGISAKPDLVLKNSDNKYAIVEYKSRHSGVYESDEKQLLATAIAVRESVPELVVGYVVTRSGKHRKIDLSISNAALISKTVSEVATVRSVNRGAVPTATPIAGKCRACSFNRECQYAV